MNIPTMSLLPTILLLPFLTFATDNTIDPPKLIYILKHDCGSCHGMTLKGGLGLPLEKENLKTRSWQELKFVILYGRAGTAMPPWKSILKDNEAEWLAKYLKNPNEKTK